MSGSGVQHDSGAPRRVHAGALLVAAFAAIVSGGVVVAGTQVVYDADTQRAQVALTFDDGWNRAACRRIASILRSHGVTGTFFVNGAYVRRAPSAWRTIVGSMPFANHTLTHVDLRRASRRVIRREIARNESLLERILRRPMLKVMRPPYGSWDQAVRRVAGRLGYRYLALWDVDTLDWTARATVASVVQRGTRGSRGSIVLMHCGPGVTPLALPAIIRSYKVRGFRMVGLDTLLGMRSGPRPTPSPEPTPTPDPTPEPTKGPAAP